MSGVLDFWKFLILNGYSFFFFQTWKIYRITENRSIHRRCIIKRDALKNFAKFTRKYLYQSLVFNEVAGLYLQLYLKKALAQVFSCEFCNIFKNFFCTKLHQATASVKRLAIIWSFPISTYQAEFHNKKIHLIVFRNLLIGNFGESYLFSNFLSVALQHTWPHYYKKPLKNSYTTESSLNFLELFCPRNFWKLTDFWDFFGISCKFEKIWNSVFDFFLFCCFSSGYKT